MGTTVLDTFITKFGYKTDTSELGKASKGMADLKAQALSIAAVVGTVLGGGFLINKIAETADETIKFADSVGVTVEALGELEFAAQRQGGTVSGLRNSMQRLNGVIGEVARGVGRAKIAFEDYGITVKKTNGDLKTADSLFLELNRKFITLSKVQQGDLAKKLGIDFGTLRLLQTAPEVIKELTDEARELGVLQRKDAETSATFIDKMTNLAQIFESLKFAIGGQALEPLIVFFEFMRDGIQFIRENTRYLKILAGTVLVLGQAWIFARAKAIAAQLAMFAVPIAIGVIILAIAAIAEDFYAFFTGAPSLIGKLAERFPILDRAIKATGNHFKKYGAEYAKPFVVVWNWLSDLGQAIIDLPGTVKRAFKEVGDYIKSFIEGPSERVLELLEKIKRLNPFGGDNESLSLAIASGSVPAAVGITPTLYPSNHNAGGPQRFSFTVKNLTVQAPNGDSREIGQNVTTALRDQFQHAVRDFDSAEDR